MDIQKSIELLRDDNNYYGEFGKQFMSNGDVKTLISNPADFKKGMDDQENLVKGRLTHILLFEPHKALTLKMSNATNRNSNHYRMDCIKANVPYLLLQKDFIEMSSLVAKVKESTEMFDLLFGQDYVYEEPNIFAYRGLYWKTKADSKASQSHVADFKTTGDISRFKWAAKDYCYDGQGFLYGMSYNLPVVFVVAEKKTGKLGVFECGPDFLESGHEKVRLALKNYDKYWNPETKTEDPSNFLIKQKL